jgi:hypothetical protein
MKFGGRPRCDARPSQTYWIVLTSLLAFGTSSQRAIMKINDCRDLLQIAAPASLILAKILLAEKPIRSFFFIDADSCNSCLFGATTI